MHKSITAIYTHIAKTDARSNDISTDFMNHSLLLLLLLVN